METQAHEAAKFPDGSLSNGKLGEGQPRWSQTDCYLPRSDKKGKTEPVRIIFKLLHKSLITSSEMLNKGYQSCYRSQKLKLVWKGLPG